MAIAFARMQILSRSARHNTVSRFRYIARLDETRSRGDLLAEPITLVPTGTPANLLGLPLWQENEDAAPRKDSIVGFELVLALPPFDELSLPKARALVEQLCAGMIVSNDLGASIAIHGPHDKAIAAIEAEANSEQVEGASIAELVEATLNWPHAHVIGTPRQLSRTGLAPLRFNSLEPLIRGAGEKRTVLCAVPWGPIWSRYQNAALALARTSRRVRLVAPHRGQHVGPARAIALLESDMDKGVIAQDRRPRVNREIEARNIQALQELDTVPDVAVFRREDLMDLMSRYQTEESTDLEARTDQYLERIAAVPLIDPVTGDATSWLTSGSVLATSGAVLALAQAISRELRATSIEASSISTLVDRLQQDPSLCGPVEDVARGQGIVTVEMQDLGSILPELNEILRHVGSAVWHVGHKAMTLAAMERRPAKMVVPSRFSKMVESGAVVILDRADTLALDEFRLLLETVQALNGQLVLIRRPHTLPFPRNVLLDRVASLGPIHRIGAWATPALIDRQALVDRELDVLVDILRTGRFRMFADESAMLDYAARALLSEHAPRVAPIATDTAARLAAAAGLRDLPTDSVASDSIILVFPGHHPAGPVFAKWRPDQISMFIDLSRISTLAALFGVSAIGSEDLRLAFAAALTGQPAHTTDPEFDLVAEVSTLYSNHFDRLFGQGGDHGGRRADNAIHRNIRVAELCAEPLIRLYPRHVVEPRGAGIGDQDERQLGDLLAPPNW